MKKEVVVGVKDLKEADNVFFLVVVRGSLVLLFFVAQFLDLASDVPGLAECVRLGFRVPEGYELLINYMANTC
ncbi:hypothetical protein F2Q70_00044293 [Brassica cretica]|uniref:Uncharacterized protein n=1 Tax=Brassica cretica TaxID=69181 RepID=A0A8S9KKS2_BRACR|nr:hypothetical protein F2Q70_00044293 [Brassica cretica]